MRDQEKDILDDLFRSKLRDFEAETSPEDWEAIANRLPAEAVPFSPSRRKWPYWAAAVVAGVVMVTATFYMSTLQPTDPQIAEQIQQETQQKEEQFRQEILPATSSVEEVMVADVQLSSQREEEAPVRKFRSVRTNVQPDEERVSVSEMKEDITPETPVYTGPVEITEEAAPEHIREEVTPMPASNTIANTPATKTKTKSLPSRKWGFGMGGGSFTAGSENTFNGLAFRNTSYKDEELLLLNATAPYYDQRTNIKHKTPVSFGLSVSRYLTNRFALLTGLNYSMLNSDWETNLDYHKKTRQRLHFIGIPLSLSYKIAEWNSFQLYAAAGAMTEVNVSGKLRERMYIDDELIRTETENTRMKEWQWSVNGRAGISYPILKYVSAFGEVGATYYFDNGSEIETIRSEKPFNVSLNFGLRVGF
ncbi:MAG: PorT family protein [Tannerellaceae bacterium]|nr:PorT family protein [Tannerellaceae bacterium]